MLIDARALDGDTTLEADVCVVGAGAAGITLAMELLDSGLRVVLLESGGREPDPATQDLAAGDITGAPLVTLDNSVRLDQTRLRYLGGTTNHWAGFCRPLSPVDFEERDHLRVSGWPIEHDELRPFWERAAGWVRISDADFSVAGWSERLGLEPPPVTTARVAPFVFQLTFPTRFGALYGADLATSESVTVVLNANAVNVATDDGRAVTRVQTRTLAGTAVDVSARAFVLATGGIENARLLLASTDADRAGLGNGTDQVGRYFAEHLQIYAGFGVVESAEQLKGMAGGEVVIPAGRHAGAVHGAKFALGLTDDHLREAPTTGLEVQMLAGSFPDGVPLQEAGAGVGDVAALLAHTAPAPTGVVYVQALAEQELDPESRVGLGPATDALGMRRVELDWRYSDADRARALEGLRVIAEAVGQSGWGRLQLVPGGVHADATDHFVPGELLSLYRSVPSEVDREGFPIGVGFHHMCTTRMSADPRAGVVDANCRVHEIDNLWIAGSSVFATPGVATPTFTIVALAVRLADHLRDLLAT